MTLQRFRSVARVSARTLLVAGFAGGIWLLTSAAAHASAPAGTTETVLNPAARPALALLDQVLTPASNGHSGHSGHSGSAASGAAQRPGVVAGSAASGAAQRPGVVARSAHYRARSAAASVTGHSAPLVASQVTPVGPARGPAASLRNGAAAGRLSALLSTVSDLVRPLRGPADLVTAPVAGLLTPVVTGRSEAVPAGVICHAAPGGAVPAGTAGAAPGRAHTSTSVRPLAGTGPWTARAAGRSAVSGTRQVPDLPERAPVPAYPGSDILGISTMASGSGHDAGGYAVVTAPVAAGQLAEHERLSATGAVVRLLLADAPTFAPD